VIDFLYMVGVVCSVAVLRFLRIIWGSCDLKILRTGALLLEKLMLWLIVNWLRTVVPLVPSSCSKE
jgi:hypothetical protein